MPNRVVHFEIETENKERAKKFYSEAFGWEMKQMGDDYGGYVTIMTGDPKQAGGINGGMFSPMEGGKKELNAYSCVIAVADINKAMEDVKTAGGKVLSEKPDDIPKVGLYVRCKDTEGNFFSMLQPAPGMSGGAM